MAQGDGGSQCTMESAYDASCIAIALHQIGLFDVHCIFFRLLTPACIYIYGYVFTLGLYRIHRGVFLALGLWTTPT